MPWWLTILTTICSLIFSGSTIGLLIDRIFLRKKNRAEIHKIVQDIQKSKDESEGLHIQQVRDSSVALEKLLRDVETLTANSQKLTVENSTLGIKVIGQSAVIEAHTKDRTEWMEILKKTLEANAEQKLQIESMKTTQELHTKRIDECDRKELKFYGIIEMLGARFNSTVEIMRSNNIDIPEGLLWTPGDLLKELQK